MSTGFYREENSELLFANGDLHTPSGHYAVRDNAIHSYPIDVAWYYFTDESTAYTGLGIPKRMPYNDRAVLDAVVDRLSAEVQTKVRALIDEPLDASAKAAQVR